MFLAIHSKGRLPLSQAWKQTLWLDIDDLTWHDTPPVWKTRSLKLWKLTLLEYNCEVSTILCYFYPLSFLVSNSAFFFFSETFTLFKTFSTDLQERIAAILFILQFFNKSIWHLFLGKLWRRGDYATSRVVISSLYLQRLMLSYKVDLICLK